MRFGEQDVECQRCKAKAIHYLNGKTSDMCQVVYPDGRESNDYVPDDLPGGVKSVYGDYVVFAWCGDCGQIQSGLD